MSENGMVRPCRPHQPGRRNLLHRTAGPYSWVKSGLGVLSAPMSGLLESRHRRLSQRLRPSRNGTLWNTWPASASFRVDIGRPNHLRPLFGVVCDELPESGRRQWQRHASKIEQPLLHPGVGESSIDLLVKLLDDVSWRALGRADALPPAGLVAWPKLAHRRNIRHSLYAICRRHPQRAHLPGPDVLDRRYQSGETNLYLSGEQVSERRRVAAIGHVDHVDAGHYPK